MTFCMLGISLLTIPPTKMLKLQVQKPRRRTKLVQVGNLAIGGKEPIRVQTMLSVPTQDVSACFKQARNCLAAGAELIRLSVADKQDLQAFAKLKLKLGKQVPLVADIHYSAELALEALAVADKIRINPGNFPRAKFVALLKEAKRLKKPLRIGLNRGSVTGKAPSIPQLVKLTLGYLEVCREQHFDQVIVSIKSAEPLELIEANRALVCKLDQAKMFYPLHLGLTEAGAGESARVKSDLALGTLLLDGIGDTIRVSLTEDPVAEVSAAYQLLQATGRRITQTEFIACPTCGRTKYDLMKLLTELKIKFPNYPGLKIAVMGCVVNGLGEARDADWAFVGGKPGLVNLYRKHKLIRKDLLERQAVSALREEIGKS